MSRPNSSKAKPSQPSWYTGVIADADNLERINKSGVANGKPIIAINAGFPDTREAIADRKVNSTAKETAPSSATPANSAM